MFCVHIIVSWLVSALALWLVAQIVPGIEVRDFGAALLATIVIALVNATIGPVLEFLAFPLTFLTLGLFLLVIERRSAEAGVDVHAGLPRFADSCGAGRARWC